METSLRITFHRMTPSEAVLADIRHHVGKLEELNDRITSCHVVVDAPHRHQHQGPLYRIHIELGVPGAQVVVGRSPKENAAHADIHVAVRDAFRAARRQLESQVKRFKATRPHQGARSVTESFFFR